MSESLFSNQSVVVVGAGSIGRFLAARLSTVADVTLICRDEASCDALNGEICLEGSQEGVFPLRCTCWSRVERLPESSLILVTTKASDLQNVLQEILRRQVSSSFLLLCQNGLGIAEEVQKQNASLKSGRMLCWFGCRAKSPNLVHVVGTPRVELAAEEGRRACEPLLQLLKDVGFVVCWNESVRDAEWRKAFLNIAINGLCASVGVPNRAVLENLHLRAIVESILDEAIAVAKAEGIAVTLENREAVFGAIENVADNLNSTLQDLRVGKRTEIDFFNGAVVAKGAFHGIPTPVNRTITHLMQFLERKD